MLQHILKQIWIQRRKNTWIFAELFIVFILAWYIIDYGFMLIHNSLISNGFNIENTYRVYYKDLTNNEEKAEFRSFYDKVRLYPGVEEAFLTPKYSGVTPYNGSMSATSLRYDTLKTSVRFPAQTKPLTSNNYFDVFRSYSEIRSGSFGRLDFSKKSIILTKNLAEAMFKNQSPVGKRVFVNDKDEYEVVDVVNNQKRSIYEEPNNIIFFPESDTTVTSPEIAIKTGQSFSEEKFKKDITNSIVSYDEVKKKQELMDGSNDDIRIRFGIMLFFLLNVALGVIGTFWFRNQTRRGEIGLRMAMGSSQSNLLKHYITEAVLILVLAVIPALCVNAALVHYNVVKTPGTTMAENAYITANVWLRFLITNGITFIVLLIIVSFSAWIPAKKASGINPVDALREE